jgi:hypothetical protein
MTAAMSVCQFASGMAVRYSELFLMSVPLLVSAYGGLVSPYLSPGIDSRGL